MDDGKIDVTLGGAELGICTQYYSFYISILINCQYKLICLIFEVSNITFEDI